MVSMKVREKSRMILMVSGLHSFGTVPFTERGHLHRWNYRHVSSCLTLVFIFITSFATQENTEPFL
jgi:hypothetical protein